MRPNASLDERVDNVPEVKDLKGVIVQSIATFLGATLLLTGAGYLQVKKRFIPQWSFNKSDWSIKGDSVYVDPNKDDVPDSVFAYGSNAVASEALSQNTDTSNVSIEE